MGVLGYSTTASSNANVLTGVGSVAENVMQVKQTNDAIRQQLADIAQMYSDVVTGIYTTGTSSAYIVATASGHTSYTNAMGLRLRFHVDSVAGAVTVNVNGLGTKALKVFASTGVRDPAANEIKADMAYDCVYVAALNCVVVTGQTQTAVDVAGLQSQIDGKQPLDADLTSIAGLSGVRGDLIRRGAAGWERLPKGSSGQFVGYDTNDVLAVAAPTVPSWTLVTSQAVAGTDAANTITGLGGYRDVRIVGRGITATVSNRRAIRVGDSGGVLSTAIYLPVDAGALTLFRVSDAATAQRSFVLDIYDFNTTNAIKPSLSSVTNTDIPVAVVSTTAFDRIQVFTETTANNLTGGTIDVYGRA